MHPRCSPMFLIACLFFLLRSPSFAHTPPAPQGSPPPSQCPAHCKCTCPAPPVSHTNTGSPPPAPNTNTGSPPPGPNTNTGSPPPAPNTNKGSPPPTPNTKTDSPPPAPNTNTGSPPPGDNTKTGSPPPGDNTNTGSPPHAPNTSKGSPPPAHDTSKGSPPPAPDTSKGSPPPAPNTKKGSPPPTPNTNTGSPPPTPNTNTGSPPPGDKTNTGSPPPAPNTSKGSPPPSPNTNKGSPPPSPNTNTGSPPPTPNTNTGSPPPTPQSNKGSPPPASDTSTGSPPPTPNTNTGSPPPTPNTHTGSPPPTPQNNKDSPPPAPNTNTGSPPPTPNSNTGSPPSMPPNNKGSPPSESNTNTGSPPEQPQNHITNTVNSVHNGSFSMVFAFGDSYTDNGNAESLNILSSAFSSSFYKSFTAEGSSTSTNGCSNGRLIIDFVSEALGLPSPPPYKSISGDFSKGANFAIAGGTSFSTGSFAKIAHNFITQGSPMGTQSQTEWFNQYRASVCKGKSKTECESHIQNALFWVGEIGLNDYMRALNSPFSLKSITELCTRDVVGLLKVILEGGAKYIVVQGLPPMGCLPFDISLTKQELLSKVGCSVAVNSAITIHNQILRIQIDLLRKQYPDRMILFANFWDAFMMILKNPQKYKFTETFKACCGTPGNNLNFNSDSLCGSEGTTACKDPNNYINWDGIHLTEAMYKQVTELFLKGGLCQPSFEEMIKKKTGGSVTSSVSFGGGSFTSSSSFSAGGSVSSSSSFTTTG